MGKIIKHAEDIDEIRYYECGKLYNKIEINTQHIKYRDDFTHSYRDSEYIPNLIIFITFLIIFLCLLAREVYYGEN